VEDDISRDVHPARLDVKAFIAFVMLAVPEENTLSNEEGIYESYMDVD